MLKQFHILIVDDDIDDHDFFRLALRDIAPAGCQLTSVYNGAQALDYLLKRNSYKNTPDAAPDFIVLDLNMPILDGWTVLKELQNFPQLTTIPVYVLTTSRDESHKLKCRQLGCKGFFSKPPKIEELRHVIKQMLEDANTNSDEKG